MSATPAGKSTAAKTTRSTRTGTSSAPRMRRTRLSTRSELVKFYKNEIPLTGNAPHNAKLTELLEWDYDRLEKCHGFIQWIFPNKEKGMNGKAPTITNEDIKAFNDDVEIRKHINKAVKLMMRFWGWVHVGGKKNKHVFTRTEDYKERYKNLVEHPHNFLRVTRMLHFWGMCPWITEFQASLLRFILFEMIINDELRECRRSFQEFWIPTVVDEKERKELEKMVQTMTEAGSRTRLLPFAMHPGFEKQREAFPDWHNRVQNVYESTRKHLVQTLLAKNTEIQQLKKQLRKRQAEGSQGNTPAKRRRLSYHASNEESSTSEGAGRMKQRRRSFPGSRNGGVRFNTETPLRSDASHRSQPTTPWPGKRVQDHEMKLDVEEKGEIECVDELSELLDLYVRLVPDPVPEEDPDSDNIAGVELDEVPAREPEPQEEQNKPSFISKRCLVAPVPEPQEVTEPEQPAGDDSYDRSN